jgi:hypothetical protein
MFPERRYTVIGSVHLQPQGACMKPILHAQPQSLQPKKPQSIRHASLHLDTDLIVQLLVQLG